MGRRLLRGMDRHQGFMTRRWNLVWLSNGKLGPDVLPVIGAQVTPGHMPAGALLDAHGQSSTAGAVAVGHIAQVAQAGRTRLGQRLTLLSGDLSKVVDELHAFNYTTLRHNKSTPIGDIYVLLSRI